jgi:6-phosphogluconolactonase
LRDPQIRWHIYADSVKLAEAVTGIIVKQSEHAIRERDAFLMVLAGGSTPAAIYKLLSRTDCTWEKWHIYFGDERCLPRGSTDRNDSMASDLWLDHVGIPAEQIHRIPAELGAQAGAEAYAETLAGVGDFDLTLLGMGEDGHTASLFPGDPAGASPQAPDALAVSDAPKPPPQRISLSAHRLAQSRNVKVLVTGAGKRNAVKRLQNGDDIPIRAVCPPRGLDLLLDQAAAPPAQGEPG